MTNGEHTAYPNKTWNGLTKRELFAKDILCALITARGKFGMTTGDIAHYIDKAIKATDTFIFALNNPDDKDH